MSHKASVSISVSTLDLIYLSAQTRPRRKINQSKNFFLFLCIVYFDLLVSTVSVSWDNKSPPPCRERTSLARRSCRVLHGEGKSYFRIFPLSKLKTFYFQPLWLKEHLCLMTWKKKEKGKLRRSKIFISLTFHQIVISR